MAGNLYKLNGRTKISHAAVVLEAASDPARLWHQRMGHMSEKGLKYWSTVSYFLL